MLETTSLVEKNYAGFSTKVTSKNVDKYNKFKKKILAKPKSTNDCIELLYEYVAFFSDPHLIITENKSKFEILDSTQINPFKQKNDPILGNWYSELDRATVAFTKIKKRYIGYVISSTDTALKKGTIIYNLKKISSKSYRGISYNKYGQKIIYESTVNGDNLVVRSLETLTRIKKNVHPKIKFLAEEINDSVYYLKFASFSLYYKSQCDSLIETNRSAIEHHKYLVVDIKDNHGGSIYSFRKLFDYIYTNPTGYVSGAYWASEDNIKKVVESLEELQKEGDSSEINSLKQFLEQLNNNKGRFYFEPPDTTRRSKIYNFPQKVIFLINENTASAAEMLIIMALQNNKTVIAGAKTHGASDYLEPQFYYLCNRRYMVGIPWVKRSRLEYKYDIDGIGIKPAINLSGIKEEDWLKYLFSKGVFSAYDK